MGTNDQIRYMNHSNRDVPPETIIRHLSREKGELQSEISELKDLLHKRDTAIAAFKQWQKKVAEYNINYWITEGVKLLDQNPNPILLKKARKVAEKNRAFAELEKKVEKTYHAVVDANWNLKDELDNTSLDEIAHILFPVDMAKLPNGKRLDLNEDVRKAWLEGVEYGREKLNSK